MSKILIGIDGTGPFFDGSYNQEMEQSFVNRILKNSKINVKSKFYHRGPSVTGVESGFIGLAAFLSYLAGLRKSANGKPVQVFITGYSRGAMIAVYLANRINDFNRLNKFGAKITNPVKMSFGFRTEEPADISIPEMMLFDAVDSDLTMWGPGLSMIPECVGKVHHFICRDSSTRLPRSRWYFQRIDLKARGDTVIDVLSYGCTHAALGGLPGQGDHRIPTTRKEVLAAGMTATTKQIASIGDPAYAAAAFVLGAGGKAYDSIRSNVTLEEDKEIYENVRAEVNRRLQHQAWETAGI